MSPLKIAVGIVVALILSVPDFATAAPDNDALKPGEIAQIKCKEAPAFGYWCYVPKNYAPEKKWPILYCFSPGGNGGVFVNQYKDGCEEAG